MLKYVVIFLLSILQLHAITVSGTVYNADSTPARGTVTITWPTFTCGTNLVMAGSRTVKLSNGALSVSLCPLDYYTVTYRLEGAPQTTLAWIVPASPSTVSILDVQTVVPPPGFLTGNGLSSVNVGTAGTDFNASLASNNLTINCPTASATNRGCLSTSDWSTFNSKLGSGTAAGGDLTGTYPNPTLAAVVAGATVGNVNADNAPTVQLPIITFDNKGRITSASVDSRAYVSAVTTFGGDVSGAFNAINVAKLNGVTLSGLSTGLLKITNGTGIPSTGVAGDVINLWSGTCNNTTFLRGDGQCSSPAGAGNVVGSGTTVVGTVPLFTDTTATGIGPGYAVSNNGTANAIARYGSGGGMTSAIGFWVGGTNVINSDFQGLFSTVVTAPSVNNVNWSSTLFADNSSNKHATFRNSSGVEQAAIDYQGNFTGRSNTALALSANPTNCAGAEFAKGIAADGSAEGCAAPSSGSSTLGFYNVKDSPYNAVGDGVNDDTAEVQAAITACQDSARGGVVYFPYGIYGISGSGVTHGNGSTSGAGNASTKAVCRFVGQGPGDSNHSTGGANVQVSALKWIGSNPGSLTYMVTIDGPMFGWGMEDLQIWANGSSNVVGLDARHINYSHIKNVAIMDTGGGPSGGAFAMKIWPQKTFTQYACYNTLENLRIRVATGSVGSALWIGGNSSLGTACSINLIGGYLNRDNEYVSGTNTATYSVLLDSSDNFHAVFTHFSGTAGSGTRNGCSIGAAVSPFTGAGAGVYPDSAHFYGISSAGMCGTTGSGRPFVVWGGECGAQGQGSCDYHNAFTGGGTKPVSLSGEPGAELKGVGQLITRYTSNDENYEDIIVNHASGGQNGAGNMFFRRDNVNIGRIKSHYFDGLGLYVGDGGGTGTLNERLRLRNNGLFTPSTVSFSDLGGEPTGSFGYCSNCQVTSGADNTCTSSGAGALAVKINGVWRCFATQN